MMPLAAVPVEKESVGHQGQGTSLEVVIASDPAEVRMVQAEIEKVLAACSYSDRDAFAIKLAVGEALTNAIKHGNQLDPSKKVRIAYQVRPDRFEVRISDEGPGFDPADVPDPTDPENLERPCGRGLMLMRSYMTEVTFARGGTSVRMTKCRNGHAK